MTAAELKNLTPSGRRSEWPRRRWMGVLSFAATQDCAADKSRIAARIHPVAFNEINGIARGADHLFHGMRPMPAQRTGRQPIRALLRESRTAIA
jgi:hypothetical protein